MSKINRFEDLQIWQDARKLVGFAYQLGATAGMKRDFGFRDQMQRAAVSIMSNIAEGFERGSNPDFVRFLHIAKGSCGEFRSLLHVAEDLGFAPAEIAASQRAASEKLSRQIAALIAYLIERADKMPSKAANRR